MPIYRLNLDRGTLLHLGVGTALLLLVVFFSGTLLGYTLSGGPQGVSAPDEVAFQIAHAGDDPVCPEPAPLATAVQRAERSGAERSPLALSALPWGVWESESAAARARTREIEGSNDPAAHPSPPEVAEAVATPEPPEPLEAVPAGRYAVQVGAFGVRENAHALASDLRARGYEPLIITARNRRGDWLEHVHLSIHADEASARAMAEDFARMERLNAVVVPALPPEVRR
jgi:cell division septation protein DedD